MHPQREEEFALPAFPGSSRHRALTAAELDAIGAELDEVRSEVIASLGEREAQYIRRVQATVRYTEIGGRALLFLGWLPPAWLAGTGLLAFSKIVDNMELGHNVMHGQYDWMNEPTLRGDTYEWDNACEGEAWRHSHNYLHHTFTNVEGRDRDIGYGFLRLFPSQRWNPLHLIQPAIAVGLAVLFQWGVALHDLELERVVRGKVPPEKLRRELGPVLRKGLRQLAKDYVFFPVLAGPAFLPVFAGNLAANLARNLWTFGIIFCGHFTADVETFPETALEDESRGAWYVRQLRGSSNLTGGPTFHFLSGNLSHQIEHHLFPDVPAVRYADMAVRVREIAERYGQYYNTGSFWSQFTSVVWRILRYSLPVRSPEAAVAA
ncbi:MAG: acyl-CoA desaturase [Deltaproteobacteria bacterium]|nr:acyl-CoA desaturase [Deltaproteobacteria bacterium]